MLVTNKSEREVTLSGSMALLCIVSLSGVVVLTMAVLVCVPGCVVGGKVGMGVWVAEGVEARTPRVYVKLPPLEVQLPCDVVVAPRVKPPGQESVRVTPIA